MSAEQVERPSLLDVPNTDVGSRFPVVAEGFRLYALFLETRLQQRDERIAEVVQEREAWKANAVALTDEYLGLKKLAKKAEAALTESQEREKALREALDYIAAFTKPGPTRNEFDAVIHATALSALQASSPKASGEPDG